MPKVTKKHASGGTKIQKRAGGFLTRHTDSLASRALNDILPAVEAQVGIVQQEADIWTSAVLGDLRGLSELLSADPNCVKETDPIGLRPIHYASIGLQPDAIFLLLRAGADANARDHRGRTPLHTLFWTNRQMPDLPIPWKDLGFWEEAEEAQFERAKRCVRVLASHGGDTSSTDSEGRSVLQNAFTWGATDIAEVLLSLGANPNVDAEDGSPLIVRVASVGTHDDVRILLEYGADPNAADSDGFTPLHAAAECLEWEMAETLLEHGARRDALWKGECTPIDKARWEEADYGRQYVDRPDLGSETNEQNRRIHDETEREYREGKSARSVSSFVEFLETWAERK